MRVAAFLVIALALAGCATPVPVDRPCGVIKDSLIDVYATTPAGQLRLNAHHERGASAGCWR
jgi:hypothetical protein